jgi:hypothetical protein
MFKHFSSFEKFKLEIDSSRLTADVDFYVDILDKKNLTRKIVQEIREI